MDCLKQVGDDLGKNPLFSKMWLYLPSGEMRLPAWIPGTCIYRTVYMYMVCRSFMFADKIELYQSRSSTVKLLYTYFISLTYMTTQRVVIPTRVCCR